uniref:Uncharacterized protein n=1 Tax=Anguilla anguilla TaxID=7936 RepID=A0A0E9U7U0_ANGAN
MLSLCTKPGRRWSSSLALVVSVRTATRSSSKA